MAKPKGAAEMSTNAMHVAKTGLDAQQTRMQVIANNLANVNTTGFKRDRASFETLLYQTVRPAGAPTSEATQATSSFSIGTGVRVLSTEKTFTQGALMNTGNALDMAIDGQGFFQVLLPDGRIGYSRDGSFAVNAEGTLTTDSGYVLQPEMAIPQGALQIVVSGDGIVSVQMPGEVEMQEVGQITLASFVNPRGLDPIGENFLVETQASGPAVVAPPQTDGMGRLVQGSLEQSNVNVVQELVDMIETQRAYEVNSKSISASDEMMRFLSNKL
jgi:flagellar basal-body rod protein FlgG